MSGHHPSLTDQMDSHDLDNIDPNKITRIYKIPSSRFQNEDEIVHYYGYTLGDKLGEGGFGVIYVATHTRSKIKVACKKVDLSKSKSGNYVTLAINYLRHIWETSESDVEKPDASKIEDMKNELFILKKMHNPYVVKLYAHFVANNHLFIFIRLANGGAMDSYIKEKGVIPERESQNFFAQILNGLEYMHSLNIAHRDMKPDNVLLVKHPNGRITLMITDFGLSRLIHVEPKSKFPIKHFLLEMLIIGFDFSGTGIIKQNHVRHIRLYATRNIGQKAIQCLHRRYLVLGGDVVRHVKQCDAVQRRRR